MTNYRTSRLSNYRHVCRVIYDMKYNIKSKWDRKYPRLFMYYTWKQYYIRIHVYEPGNQYCNPNRLDWLYYNRKNYIYIFNVYASYKNSRCKITVGRRPGVRIGNSIRVRQSARVQMYMTIWDECITSIHHCPNLALYYI